MVESENIARFTDLIEEIIQDYVETGNYEIIEFKKQLKNLISNPLSFDKRIQKLVNLIEKSSTQIESFDYLWQTIENILRSQSSEQIINKELQKEKIRTYEKKLIKFLMDIGKKKGTNEILSAIIGYLLIHKRLTQSELKKLSGYSRGAISENLKILINYGFVQKEPIEGTRKHQYSIGESMGYVAENVSITKSLKTEELLNFVNKKISQLKAMDNQERNGFELLLSRLGELEEFCILMENILHRVISSEQIQSIMGDKFESK